MHWKEIVIPSFVQFALTTPVTLGPLLRVAVGAAKWDMVAYYLWRSLVLYYSAQLELYKESS